MDFEPLTPPPGTQSGPEMALTLTSTPNSFGGIKSFTSSQSVTLFNSKSLNDSEPNNSLVLPYNNHKEHSTCNSSNSFVDSGGDSDASSAVSEKIDNEEVSKLENADLSDDDDDDDDEPVDCANCNQDFPSLQSYMDHKCATKIMAPTKKSETEMSQATVCNEGEISEGESFDGKIVYNSDGSAYIIEGADSDLSDLDSIIDIPDSDGIIVDKKGSDVVSQVPAFPHIANAFFVSRNPNFNGIYSIPSSHNLLSQAPMMFSYRVYDVRTGKSNSDHSNDSSSTSDESSVNVPTKPILMCFICKLSFGYAKSFTTHATTEHDMCLNENEKRIIGKKNASAIIQCVGKEKEPLMSFLEPKPLASSPNNVSSSPQPKSPSNIHLPNNSLHTSYHNSTRENTSVSFVYSKPKLSSTPLLLQMNSKKSFDDNSQGGMLLKGSEVKKEVPTLSHGATNSSQDKSNDENEENNVSDKNGGDSESSISAVYDISGMKHHPSSSESNFLQKLKYSQDPSCLGIAPSTCTATFSPVSSSPCTPLPMTSPGPSPMVFLGMCDEHPQGRVQGVECPKCDMVLGSSQSLGGHMTMMHSRNSCKTLKCPKCNWHYKYQETLEIHMKEKHPENDQQCIYCISNQPHPRLARGESYSCGYKPYRCEVCNYSTTTKGNLSIHMQSDKHLNNVQELANGGEMKMVPQQQQTQQQQQQQAQQAQQQQPGNDPLSQMKKNKPKPTWRCDVCNYETNVARNLRIHMTSEKHTHNMMVLQQNMKHMQRDIQIQQMNQLMLLQNDPSFLAGLSTPMAGNVTYPYDQSMLLAGLQGGFGEVAMDLRKENGGVGVSFDPQTPDAARLFQCCVCNLHATDSLESLHQHLQLDRTKHREQESISVSQGTYMCNLCQYKTQLKANFQLHCKTDKHLQRLQLVNHIKEGGPSNEWRLKYLNVSNPVQVRCNSCDYYTNSIHKLQIHTSNPRHESNSQLFRHLQHGESQLNQSAKKYYYCSLCNFSTRAKLNLIQHVRSMKHLHNEGIKQMQMKELNITEIDPGEIFVVKEYSEDDEGKIKFDEEDCEGEGDDSNVLTENDLQQEKRPDIPSLYTTSTAPASSVKISNLNNNNNSNSNNNNSTGAVNASQSSEDQIHVCPYCDYSSVSEMRIQAHIVSQHTQHSREILCPLCQEDFKDKARLEKHLMATHNVKAEGLQRLLLMVDKGDWMVPTNMGHAPSAPSPNIPIDETGEINTEALEAEAARLAAEDAIDTAALPDKGDIDDQYRCQTCSKTFNNIDGLYAHQNELGHLELKQTPRGPGYLCWKKGCNQYFKTAQALQVHFREIHAKRQPPTASDRHIYKYRCNQCSLAFKTPEKLQLHSHYHIIRAATKCNFCGRSFRSVASLRKHVDTGHSEISESEREQYLSSMNASSAALATVLASLGMDKFVSSSPSCVTPSASSTATVNSITSPVVCATPMEKPAESAKTDLNSNETLDKSDPMDMSSPEESDRSQSEGMDIGASDGSVDPSYKDQQFLEDYMNSQAIAEGSYEDPNRKFKCHRCKVAFTKQSYLTAHNKTLLHRKGDKISYPMEKYLDPNRPFKCDVCKESFTQKNILLVHYNSVSHLHKVKQASQQGTLPVTTATSPSPQQAETTTSSLSSSSSDAPQANSSKMGNSDSEKPFKCNICKVCYSQGTTLDIHVRSVGHQKKASKLHELVLTGQVDLSQPLIEQPNDSQLSQQQQQKIMAEMLQPQQLIAASSAISQPSLLFSGIPGIAGLTQLSMLSGLPAVVSSIPEMTKSSPATNSSQTPSVTSPSKSQESTESKSQRNDKVKLEAKIEKEDAVLSKTEDTDAKDATVSSQHPLTSSAIVQPTYLCHKCNAVFTNQDSLTQHQLMCLFQSSSPLTPQSQIRRPTNFVGRVKPQVQKNLLENIGFECVMQFNEFNQPVTVKKETDNNEESNGDDIKEEEEMEVDKKETADKKESDLPEMNKCVCTTCKKEFSSVWVLKAHQEEVHKHVVPTEAVEDFGEKFKSDYEKKQPKESENLTTATGNQDMSISSSNSGSSNTESNSAQGMPPPPPPPPQMSPQMDLSQMMPMFGLGMPMPVSFNMAMAMNMQPPLLPVMFPMTSEANAATSPLNISDTSMQNQQKQQAAQLAAQQAAMNQKRARTRINDEQLKILRAHFDINNSPSEEQILAMSEQSGLPTKVIKHWFRNTLFKERQRNKDSPYNFSVPPSTTLDLEEYEKTGKIPVVENSLTEVKDIKKEVEEDPISHDAKESVSALQSISQLALQQQQQQQIQEQLCQQQLQMQLQQQQQQSSAMKEKLMEKAPKMEPSRPESPDQGDSRESFSNMSGSSSVPSTPNPMTSFALTAGLLTPRSGGDDIRPRFDPSQYQSGYSKRANRTRFTDYQIKVLQEYFEQNAYPKDDELDHLSQILNLSPRVIVVWFQNARQKARKIYENQPVDSAKENSNSPFQRTPGLNYQCKKCSAVFQRYYDLIRHQKKQCGLDTDKIQMPLHANMDDDTDSLSTLSHENDLDDTASTNSHDMSTSGEKDHSNGINFKCEKCLLSFDRLDLWQEHQNVHSMNPSLFGNLSSNSAFGVLQSMAAAQQQQQDVKMYMKRKMEDDKDNDSDDQPRDKRLRTTILPEQLDYLYQKYQVDCNPSRKQLENISTEVGLKKRVVQVWFQNTRARERKGQYRAHQQLIHKRCPFCRALFRAKSALESHLATKHPEEVAKGDINVDAIPDAAIENPSGSHGMHSGLISPTSAADLNKMLSPPGLQSYLPGMPLGGNSFSDQLHLSMKQFYEDSYKKYMSDLSTGSMKESAPRDPEMPTPSKHHVSNTKSSSEYASEAPLDLSKPLKVSTENDKHSDGPSTDLSDRSFDDHNLSNKSLNDSYSETYSNHENDDSTSITTSRPSSPSPHGSMSQPVGKRYRTQMTSLQVRIMKSIFLDYKTPTMAECEMLGREIGLPKRVVQVWFQNARAKEKKAKLSMNKSYNSELDFPKPPEECTLCHFKYSHKYTIQDHIFTKKHLEKVRQCIQSQSDVERDLSSQSSSSGDILRQQHEMDRMRKAWDEAAVLASAQPHLAQLQAMGLNALGRPPPGLSGGSFNPADLLKDSKDKKSDSSETEKKSESSKQDDTSSLPLGAHLMSPFAGFLPGLDPTMLSYMGFPGMPGFIPGMGMPFLPPGFMPGAEQMLQYDPMTFGTPLPLLQIPQQAIKDVSLKLSEPKATVAQYTQDCKSMASLKSLVNGVDYSCARESTVDVGYICKKCQTVYPAKEACVSHQSMCFPGGKVHENPMLKLEQIQYECRLCADKVSTVQEYKVHCQTESHKLKASRLQQQKLSSSPSKSPVSSVSSPAHGVAKPSSSQSPVKSHSSSILSSPLPKTDTKTLDVKEETVTM